jgi:hypothetical protein
MGQTIVHFLARQLAMPRAHPLVDQAPDGGDRTFARRPALPSFSRAGEATVFIPDGRLLSSGGRLV